MMLYNLVKKRFGNFENLVKFQTIYTQTFIEFTINLSLIKTRLIFIILNLNF